MSKIRVGIVGVGNCASSLVQGVQLYKHADQEERVPGLMHVKFGPYHVGDIEFAFAADVMASKVGKDLSEAIFAEPNNTIKLSDVPHQGVRVVAAPHFDGIGEMLDRFPLATPEFDDPEVAAKLLWDAGVDVLVNYLPVGSEMATRFWAEAALQAGVAFVNGIPVFIASDERWAERFRQAGIPVIGDDIKSQLGATILHRALAQLFEDRGLKLHHTYQLNFGGNTDFLNMLERSRLQTKKVSKTEAVVSVLSDKPAPEDVHIGPSDYVPWLKDQKVAYIRMEGSNFGGAPVTIEVRLQVWDSPNSAGVMIDAIRAAKLALDRGIGGPLEAVSAYLMKHPPRQIPDAEAKRLVEAFIQG